MRKLNWSRLLRWLVRWAFVRAHAAQIRRANLQAIDLDRTDQWVAGAVTTLETLELLEEDCL